VSGDFGQVRDRAQNVHNTNHRSPITNHQSPITKPTSVRSGTALKMSITPITNHQSPITNHQSPNQTDFGQVRDRVQNVHNTNHQSITNRNTSEHFTFISPITRNSINHQEPGQPFLQYIYFEILHDPQQKDAIRYLIRSQWLCGSTVERPTPDRKVPSSNLGGARTVFTFWRDDLPRAKHHFAYHFDISCTFRGQSSTERWLTALPRLARDVAELHLFFLPPPL
jgi:hypothetical protein